MENHKQQLLGLQSQRDHLRSKLQAMTRMNQWTNERDELHKTLSHLDGLWNRLTTNTKLSKWGRLL